MARGEGEGKRGVRGEVSSPQQSCYQSLSPNENCIVCWQSLFWILMLLLDFDAVVVIFIYRLLLFLLGFCLSFSLSYCCCICFCCLLLFCVFAAFAAFAVNFAGGSSVCSRSLQRCFDYEAASTFLPSPFPLIQCLPLLPLAPLHSWASVCCVSLVSCWYRWRRFCFIGDINKMQH